MKVLINALIIILILHFIIKNFEDGLVTGYDPYILNSSSDLTEDMRLQYLMDDEGDLDLHQSNNNDYLQFMETEDTRTDDGIMKVKPQNFYEEVENKPNFESNVTDISKYFQTNYDSIVVKNIGNDKKIKEPIEKDPISKTHCYIDDKDNGCTISNVEWKYKDERVQNGGDFVDGVTAFDGIGLDYAVYDTSQLNLQTGLQTGLTNQKYIDDISIPK
tara:strand:+ start:1561 stop:2211 length:651 start_codon:yes stop_codon:yes gene_type:complete